MSGRRENMQAAVIYWAGIVLALAFQIVLVWM